MRALYNLRLRPAHAVRATVPIWTLLILSLWGAPAFASHTAVQGYGANSQGGTGKPSCVVTNTNAAGSGSLRACLAGGNKNITFSVGGVIDLTDDVLLIENFTTVNGLTAPSPGITIKTDSLRIWDTQHVILRGLRMRDVGFTGTFGSTGTVWGGRDCIDVQGTSQHLVFDHMDLLNCGDGGIDLKIPTKDVTIQWSILSTWKTALWGGTDTTVGQPNEGRISFHHNAIICNDRGPTNAGCDRNPLIRAQGKTPIIDLRYNVIEGWYAANGVKIEPNALVNVIGNAFLPRADSSVNNREESIHYDPGPQVYTAGNVEYPVSGSPVNMNMQGNMGTAHSTPAITEYARGCVVQQVGVVPRDSLSTQLVGFLGRVPTATGCPSGGGGGGGGGGSATLAITPTTVVPSGTVTVTITGGPASPSDWIAIGPAGSGSFFSSWRYLNGSQTMPSAGLAAATVTLVAPSGAGNYDVRFYANDTLNLVSGTQPKPFTVSAVSSNPTITVSPNPVTTGASFTVSVTNGPGFARDWIAIYDQSQTNPDLYTNWFYLNGTKSAPSTPVTSATVTFPASSACTSGQCKAVFYRDEQYNLLTSVNFSMATAVGASSATATVLTTQALTVQMAITIGTNRPAVSSIAYKANGTTFATTSALSATWTRPLSAGPFAFTAVITYVGGTTETVTPTPASVP